MSPISMEKSIVNALPKVVGFLRVLRFPPGIPVSSHRES